VKKLFGRACEINRFLASKFIVNTPWPNAHFSLRKAPELERASRSDGFVRSRHSRAGGNPDSVLAKAGNHERKTGFPFSRETLDSRFHGMTKRGLFRIFTRSSGLLLAIKEQGDKTNGPILVVDFQPLSG
jgi:hypothetical protein